MIILNTIFNSALFILEKVVFLKIKDTQSNSVQSIKKKKKKKTRIIANSSF